MRVVFAGTPAFAVPTLKKLLASHHQVIAVYTQPDRPAGRGRQLTASLVKQCALTHAIPVYQPQSFKTPQAQAEFAALNPDVMVVAAYGLILPQVVLDSPKYGCINIHASLLPRGRGASPIQQAILADDSETGVTIMQMAAGLDAGPMLLKTHCPIDSGDTTETLQEKLADQGAEALMQTLDNLNTLIPIPQDDSLATYAGKIQKTDAQIDWQQPAEFIDRQVRAYQPWPVAYCFLMDDRIKIYAGSVIKQSTDDVPGTIVDMDAKGLDIATGKDIYRITRAQFAGGRILPISTMLALAKNPLHTALYLS